MEQCQKPHDREAGFDWLLPTELKTGNREKAHVGSFFFQEIMERALKATHKGKKGDLLGNMFASCCPITFTGPHRLVQS